MEDDTLFKWTKKVYTIIQALTIIRPLKLGNLKHLDTSIQESFCWLSSDLGFSSNVPLRPYKTGSVKLEEDNENLLIDTITKDLCELLFTDLITILDETVKQVLLEKEITPNSYLSQNIKKFTLDEKYDWAEKGIVEAYQIRNCILHNNSKWSKRAIDKLNEVTTEFPIENSEIKLSYEDLFRYKRAVRTFIGEIKK